MHNLRYPIALHKSTNRLKNILDIESGEDCGCICFKCEQPLVAINKERNKQRPHFRHHPGSNCIANFESYIHWLAKEVICRSDTFTVPEIISKVVLENAESRFVEEIEKLFVKHKIPDPFRKHYKYKFVLQEKVTVDIESCELEFTFKSNLGVIKVDAKIESKGQKLLVEPFYTNPIDENKKQKIRNIDESVVSINLGPFGPGKKFYFTLKEFKKYVLKETNLKAWIHIKGKKNKSLERKYLNKIDELLVNSKEFFNKFEQFEQKITDEEAKLDPIKAEIKSLEKKLSEARIAFGEGFKLVQDIKNEKLKYGNSYLADDQLKTNPVPWHLRSFDD